MASNNGRGDEEQLEKTAELNKTLKGERIIPPTQRPDGSLRKPICIRDGYVPQDEVPIKGALKNKEMASQAVPPGYDPPTDAKPKKEKRVHFAVEDLDDGSKAVKSLTSQMTDLSFSASRVSTSPPSNSVKASEDGMTILHLDKKIRALRKKVRLAEAQRQKTPRHEMKPELLEKFGKLGGWIEELRLLENKKAEFEAL